MVYSWAPEPEPRAGGLCPFFTPNPFRSGDRTASGIDAASQSDTELSGNFGGVGDTIEQPAHLDSQPACPACPTQIVVVPTAVTTANPTEDAAQQTAEAPTEEVGTKCFQFDFLGDVNYPPGTVMKPGTKFSKTWTVKNTGTCTWTRDYDMVLAGGEAFGTNKRGDIPRDVLPGETIDLTINDMVAPMTEGTYYSYWMLAAPDGARIGYGPNQQWGLGIQVTISNN